MPEAALLDWLADAPAAEALARAAASTWLRSDEGLVDLADAISGRARADLSAAERLAGVAQSLLGAAPPFPRARLLRSIGHVHALRSRLEAALDAYDAALDLFEAGGHALDAAVTRSGALQTLIYLGRYDRALDWAESARAVFLAAGDRQRLARLETNLGNILYRQDRFDDAYACYRRALEAFEAVGAPQDIAIALRNRAVVEISLHRFDDAEATYREARAWCDRHGLAALVAEVDYNIAYLFYQRGEYARAIELYRVARERCVLTDDRYHAALCDLDQSELYLEINLVAEGLALARRAETGFASLRLGYERAKAVVNVATGEHLRGRTAEADRRFRQARRMFAAEGNALWPPIIDLYRALVLERDAPALAERLCRSALAFFARTAVASRHVLSELLLARLRLRRGDTPAAIGLAHAALQRASDAGLRPLSYQAAVVIAQCAEADGAPEAAIDGYRRAHAILDELRGGLRRDELKIAFLRDKQVVFDRIVALLARHPDRAGEAFFWMERARSRSLAEQIAAQASTLPLPDAVTGSHAGRLRELRERLHGLQHEVDRLETASADPRRLARLRADIQRGEGDLVRLFQEIGASAPEYVDLHAAGSADVEAVRAVLPADTALVEYFEAGGRVLACTLDRDRIDLHDLAPADEVRRQLELLRFQFSKFRLGGDYVRRFEGALAGATHAHLRALHDQLWQPLSSALADARHVVVVPHGRLHYVPFHALHDGSAYVVDRLALSYSPSASVLCSCRSRPATATEPPLVLGVTDPALPGIAHEVTEVAAALDGSRLHVGESATYARLVHLGARARVIHVATHGVFREDSPLFSSVRLADRHLSLFDLYHQRLSADLVTLSGCATGLNVVEGGDELVGLTRGLLYAGARAVLVTLWDVHDASVAESMTAFYRRLAGGDGLAEALAAVMRDRRKHHPHPYYWAPFVLVGEFGRVASSRP